MNKTKYSKSQAVVTLVGMLAVLLFGGPMLDKLPVPHSGAVAHDFASTEAIADMSLVASGVNHFIQGASNPAQKPAAAVHKSET